MPSLRQHSVNVHGSLLRVGRNRYKHPLSPATNVPDVESAVGSQKAALTLVTSQVEARPRLLQRELPRLPRGVERKDRTRTGSTVGLQPDFQAAGASLHRLVRLEIARAEHGPVAGKM